MITLTFVPDLQRIPAAIGEAFGRCPMRSLTIFCSEEQGSPSPQRTACSSSAASRSDSRHHRSSPTSHNRSSRGHTHRSRPARSAGFGRRDVVDVGWRHRKVHRVIGIRIIDNVRLGAEDIGRECRPVFAQAGEPQAGRINSRTASLLARRRPGCACFSICVNSSLNSCHGRLVLASDIVERFTGAAPR